MEPQDRHEHEVPQEHEEEVRPTCTLCGSGEVHPNTIRSAFWHGERLVVVEDIPALVCARCGEQFYDDATVVEIDQLRGQGFPPEASRRELRVPVFSFRDRRQRYEEP